MTPDELQERLDEIRANVDINEYPQTFDLIDIYYFASGDYFALAEELMETDADKEMHPFVASLVRDILLDEIKRGNADAACDLGSIYYTGRIGEQNFKKAVDLYTYAAENGSRPAAENLGYCYYYGRDVEKDYEKAFHYFALGAFDGHLISLYKIGDMYKNGYYVQKNEKEAFYIYTQCVETMDYEAEAHCGADIYMRMGDCYYKGIGTSKDLERALCFFQKAESLFRIRLRNGDFLIKKSYEHCVEVQDTIRKQLEEDLPPYEWTKF